MLKINDKKNSTLFVELSADGAYWNVNRAAVFREGYSKGKEVIWSLPAFEITSTAGSQGIQDATKSSNPMSGNSPHDTSSVNKDNKRI